MTSAPPCQVDVLGVEVAALRLPQLLEIVDSWVDEGAHRTLGYVNAHVLNLASRDAELHDTLRGLDLCYCDGNGVRIGARLLGHELPERMTGADWIWDLAARSAGRRRLFWLGGEPGITETAAARLRDRHPDLHMDHDHGFHPRSGPEDKALVARINAARPDILLVGMGTPLQERWVTERRARLDVPVVWILGATADFISGKVARPGPDWLVERAEWLSRLAADPRRLAGRYLVGNAEFLARVSRQRLREGRGVRTEG